LTLLTIGAIINVVNSKKEIKKMTLEEIKKEIEDIKKIFIYKGNVEDKLYHEFIRYLTRQDNPYQRRTIRALNEARRLYPKFTSFHQNLKKIRKETIQTAAMVMRYSCKLLDA
jgi:hypothetical protein